MKYNYSGVYRPIPVTVITFHSMPDYIFSDEQWKAEGGWKGLVKSGAFNLRDVKKVIKGNMNPIEFDKLNAWEG